MSAAALDNQLQLQCLTVVAATLHIGNISFVEDGADGFASIADEECLFLGKFIIFQGFLNFGAQLVEVNRSGRK